MTTSDALVDNPGLIQYVFALNPDSTELVGQARAFCEPLRKALRDYWEQATSTWERHPDFSQSQAFPSSLAPLNSTHLLAAAQMQHPAAAHQAFLFALGDIVVITVTLCENQPQSSPAAWGSLLNQYGSVLGVANAEGLLSVQRVFFAERPAATADELALLSNCCRELRNQLGGSAVDFQSYDLASYRDERDWLYLRPVPVEILARGDAPLFRDNWLLLTPAHAPLDRELVVPADPLNLPRRVQYMVEAAKSRYYEQRVLHLAGQFRGIRQHLLAESGQFAQELARQFDPEHHPQQLSSFMAQHSQLRNEIDELAAMGVTLGIARRNLAWFTPPPHPGGAQPPNSLFAEDAHVAERACFQAESEAKYWGLHENKMRTLLEFLRTILASHHQKHEKAQEESHKRFEQRLHLLEVFVIAVESAELYHIYHQAHGVESHSVLTVITLGVAALVALYIYRVGQTARREKTSGWFPQGISFPFGLLLAVCLLILIMAYRSWISHWFGIDLPPLEPPETAH